MTREAMINGTRSYQDVQRLVRDALAARQAKATGSMYAYVCVCDLTDSDVVYTVDDYDELFQSPYAIDRVGIVTLGEPEPVVRTYTPAPNDGEPSTSGTGDGEIAESAMESRATRAVVSGRVLEAQGTDADGGRIFGVRVIAYGDSLNGRRYPETVMRAAKGLYEGAKVFDHHRTEAEMSTGSTAGLIGQIRGVTAGTEGLDAQLHLLPSATRAAEALDASLAAEADGLPPLVGMSHDVMAQFQPVTEGGVRLQEATQIVSVNSADVVVDPAAGGRATRVVAGGTNPSGDVPDQTEEQDVAPTKADILAAFQDATDDELAAVGLARAANDTTDNTDAPAEGTESATETIAPGRTVETGQPKAGFLGKLLVRTKVADAGLPESVTEAVTAALPDRITESDVDAQIAAIKAGLGLVERAGLAPTVTAQVTQESLDKKRTALDAMFAGDYSKGYRSFREAFVDFTGRRPRAFDEDFSRTILRESIGHFDSGVRAAESGDTTTWSHVLGDSITRRLVAEYQQPSLQTWRQIVSSTPPISDFRTQRIERIGGYGTLPAVNQGAPYQPLSTPSDEEVTYAVTKRGGTEDVTLEMIANDDIRAIQRIPRKLGLAAAQTLYRFVWDMLPTNGNIYDGNALFDSANHGNTDTGAALSQSTLSTARRKLRQQAAFDDSVDVLSMVPRNIVVPSALEEIAFQLATSAVAIPATPAGPTDTPNIHRGLNVIVVDYFSDANDWFVVVDPAMCPTIEVGFYQGRQDPELFTQSDPTVGSMFNADKVTYKIRHIYSGAVLDYRGFYRGQG